MSFWKLFWFDVLGFVSEVLFERGSSNVVDNGRLQNFPSSSYEAAMEKLSSLITRQRRGEKPPIANKLEKMSMYLKVICQWIICFLLYFRGIRASRDFLQYYKVNAWFLYRYWVWKKIWIVSTLFMWQAQRERYSFRNLLFVITTVKSFCIKLRYSRKGYFYDEHSILVCLP